MFSTEPIGYKLCGSLLAHSRTAGDIVGGIAFQCEHVDYLPGRFYAISFAYLFGPRISNPLPPVGGRYMKVLSSTS